MAKPILELISDVVVSRLEEITTANEYEFTANSVQLVDRDKNEWTPEALDIYVDQQESTINEELSFPGNPPANAFTVTYEITGFSRVLDTSDTELGVVDSSVTDQQIGAAIKKAIASSADWHNFDGYSINAELSSSMPIDGPGHDGTTVIVSVVYRISELDPFTKR